MKKESLMAPALQSIFQLALTFVIPHLSNLCAVQNISPESLSTYTAELEKRITPLFIKPQEEKSAEVLKAKPEITYTHRDSRIGNFEGPGAPDLRPAKQPISGGDMGDADGLKYGDAGAGKNPIIELRCVDISPFADLLALFSQQMKGKIASEYASIKEALPNGSEFLPFFEDVEKISSALMQFLKKVFGDGVANPGDFIAKSYLINQSLSECFPAEAEQKELIKSCISSISGILREGGYDDATFLEEIVDPLLLYIEQKKNASTPQERELLHFFPFQDLLFLLLLGLFAVRHLSEVRPFLQKHLDAGFSLMHVLQLDFLFRHEESMRLALKTFLTLLAPLEKAITTKAPIGKNTAIRAGINTCWYFIEKQMREKVRSKSTKISLEDKKRLETDIATFSALKELFLFAALGAFGSKGKETEALSLLEERLQNLYQDLYRFDLTKMQKNSDQLQTHIKTVLSSL